MNQRLLLALLLVATPSCFLGRSQINKPIDPQPVVDLVPGQSDADDVLAALGAPADVVQLGHHSAWRYDFTRSKGAGVVLILFNTYNNDVQQDRVWAFFDENDVLTHIGGTFEADDASYKFVWQD